ncbi:DUF2922 domain-containing protein [Enterococcus sp. AZ109]|uniref:DUF2922 domain-containing protein n=1 Tax=Enterococcus sp. AZ109 TaxID=2774634 RepID=UPI003F1FA49A
MLKLKAVFEDATGKTHRWSFNEPDPTKSPEKIKEALETMTTLNLFEKNGVRQFQKVVSAKFVETIETPIFDVREQAEIYVADPDNAFAPLIVADEEAQVSEPAKKESGVETVTPAMEEKAQAKPVDVEQNAALETIEAVNTPKSIMEKVGIHSQSKAALNAALAQPTVDDTSKTVVTSDAVADAAQQSNEIDSTESDEKIEADPANTEFVKPIPRNLSPVQARKEKIDRLRAYHEANKKKQKKKKGKKKKR